MKNIFFTLTLLLTFLSCDTEVKNESQTGIIEGGDAKSLVMDAFNDAYLANDMTGQEAIFTEDAVANVNGQEMTPAEKKAFFNKIDSKYKAKSESDKSMTDTGKKKTPVDTKPTIEYNK